MKNGFDKERDLVDFLLFNGYEAVRVAGSGAGTKRGLPDIIAGKQTVKYAIELKSSTKNDIYIKKDQIKGLINFSNVFGAIPVIAIKFKCLPYSFMSVNDLPVLNSGNYKITRYMSEKFKNKLVLSDC